MCTYPVQPVCTSLLHIPVHITIYQVLSMFAHLILLHILLFIFSSSFYFLPIFIYILLCCVTFFFALSIERT